MFFYIQPVFFATDIMLFIFTVMMFFCVQKTIKNKGRLAVWRPLFKNRMYGICFVILTFFFSITLVDSIHFKLPVNIQSNNIVYGNNIYSLFDVIVSPLGTIEEQTYSKPFAKYNLNKSYEKLPDGNYKSYYKPLKLANKSDNVTGIQILLEVAANIMLLVIALLAIFTLKSILGNKNTSTTKRIHQAYKKLIRSDYFHLVYSTIICLAIMITLITISKYYHTFGTNKVGQDVCFQALKSIRTGMILGTITTLFSLPFAIILGISAGYFGKAVDDIIQYIYTTISAIPGILLISAAILSLQVWIERNANWFNSLQTGADLRLLMICFILGITGWPPLCRLLRGETLKIREMDYITAAKTLGVSKFNILFKHILPNVMHIVLIVTVIDFSGLVLAEAVLSYIGVGVDPTTTSWGNMINSARLELARDPAIWWSLSAAFLFMSAMVLAANIFADGVRDIFDPRCNNK